MTLYGVAGTQAAKVTANSIIAFKMFNLHPTEKKEGEDEEDEEEEEDEENSKEDPEKQPKLKVASIKHPGPINRVRCQALGPTLVAGVWAERGVVGMWNMNNCMQKLDQPVKDKEWFREDAKPLFEFSGHLTEGFALNWSPLVSGVFASGDCKKNIHLWKPNDSGSWNVDQRPLVGHTDSVEDVLWSPNESNVLASCSVDKSIRIWDCRASPDKACMITVSGAHQSDVNVIDWNKHEPFIVSGGDDGFIKVWDLRTLNGSATPEPVATFKHHTAPITSVQWNRKDPTVLASSGADDQICLWDLALEKDEGDEDEQLKDLPPQLLFIHQGLQDIKELHWHPQVPGLVMSTSHSGFDVFRTISV